MEILAGLAAGALFAAGLYLMLRRNIFAMFIGLVILSHAVNLLLFTAGGLTRGEPPVLAAEQPAEPVAEPLPQALILTAIVIGLGVQSFLFVLVYRLTRAARTVDPGVMRQAERDE